MSEVICKECGSKENRWHLGKLSSIPDGKMALYHCSVIFYLGCEDCSETLKIIHDDDYMEMFDNLESENAKLKQEIERHATDREELKDCLLTCQDLLTHLRTHTDEKFALMKADEIFEFIEREIERTEELEKEMESE